MASNVDKTSIGALQRRLILVALLALLPVALLSFAGLYQIGLQQRQQLLDSAQDTMRAVATSIDTELRLSGAALQALALSPRLAQKDFGSFRAEAAALMAQRPEWSNVVLSTPQAQQVLNLRIPPGSPLPSRVDPEAIERTVRTAKPQVGNLVLSPVTHTQTVAVLVPVFEGDRVVHVLTAVVRPTALRDLLLRQRIPEDGVVGVMDRNLHFVTRSRDHEQWIGRSPVPALREALQQAAPQGELRWQTVEGQLVYTVYQRLPDSGWSVAAGIPVERVDAPIRLAFVLLGGFLLLSVILGMFAATLLTRTIVSPMAVLKQAAEQLGRGEAPVAPVSTLPEVQAIAKALGQAHREREALLVSERQARQAAETANRHKDQFLAMLGHELRNPLAALSSAATLLEIASEREQHDVMQRTRAVIRRQLGHLGRLADDLLDAGRAIVGKLQLQREALELSALVRGVVATFTDTGTLSAHQLRLSLQPAWVYVDPTRLEQAVGNLLANAVKYTPGGGTIDITLVASGMNAQLTVTDNGIGLEADLLPKVFDLFVQGERSLARSEGGLGLGLTLVRRIIELHGGSVDAHSEGAGLGSAFTLTLPLVPGRSASLPAAPRQALRGPCTLVLVEDNEDLRTGLRTLLELHGHAVHEAGNGPDGIATILRERPQVALIDIGLPGCDGWAVARRVREACAEPPLLVALSGYDDALAEPPQRADFDAYLIKPVQLEQLEKLIETVDVDRPAREHAAFQRGV